MSGHENCCHVSNFSQTLEEIEFDRSLWTSALYGRIDKLVSLLTRGNDVNTQDKYGYTALHYGARNNQLRACEILLNYGANAKICTRSGKATAIHRASYNGHLGIVQLLSKTLAKENCLLEDLVDVDGQTCLHSAARGNQAHVFGWLSKEYPNLSKTLDNAGLFAHELFPI